MKAIFFLLAVTIFAMLPLGTTAQIIRLRRSNPVIEVGLSAVRQIVGPFGSFIIKRKHDQEDIIEDNEDEFGDNFSLSYDYDVSMSMSMPSIDLPAEAPSTNAPPRGSRFRRGRFRRQSGGRNLRA